METHTTFQHGLGIQMQMFLKDISQSLLNKHELSKKEMHALLLHMEQWSTSQNKQSKIQASTVNSSTYRRSSHGIEILLSIQSRKLDDV